MKKNFKKKIAIICARAGSKRVKNKNLRSFFKKPIIVRVIEEIKKTGLFDTILVSTDSKKIAKLSIKHGAKVPFFRSKKNSNDKAPIRKVIREVLLKLKKKNHHFKYLCFFYGTSVFSKKTEIKKGYKLMVKKNYDVVIPLIETENKFWRSYRFLDKEKVRFNFDKFKDYMSQDLEKIYTDAGEWGWVNVKKFFKNKNLITKNMGAIIKKKEFSQDINTLEEWKKAEEKFKKLRSYKL